ncbi:protein FAR1-RELATED SEQUENCE 5-like [Rutidosis leptorrhynchoides]|uniref:protein FAR1-RELATED SEQUENCE 5-like n=1 Tax=Rutidosis leptorrhynchoides TaxID=125765 RepID=UPI003A99362A
MSDGSWMLKSYNLRHNHDPATDMSGHASSRQLSADEIKSVKEMTMVRIPPRQILSSLRQRNSNLSAISRTIYNVKKQIRKDNLKNRSIIGALFEELAKGGFTYDILHNSEGRITRLFIAHPLSIKLARIFSNTFVMDCTYKTNRYNMPLLDIIEVSCFNSSFYSGFAFLEKEDEENYIWALHVFKKILGQGNYPSIIMSDRELALMNGKKNVFPSATNLLCVWHIEKNMLANCKKHFDRGEDCDNFMLGWKNVVYSMNEELLYGNWREFELIYKEKKSALDYIKNTWFPWKEKFISVWTEKYLHFGCRTSSRVEGAHVKLKMYLQASTCDFHQVEQKISLAVKHEFNEIKVQLASEKIQIPHNCNMPLFRELIV